MHQDMVAVLDPTDVAHRPHARSQGHRQRNGLFGRESRFVLQHEIRGNLDELSVGTGNTHPGEREARCRGRRSHLGLGFVGRETRHRDHTLTELESCNAFAERRDLAGRVRTEDVREGELRHDAAFPDVVIEAVDASRQDPDQHVTWPRHGD